ncbi:MAG: helix-turn-helix domain-containing protein, partial [Candidatus Limnocylindria bacterium]
MQRQRSAEARNRILEQVQRMGRELLLARTTSGLPRSRAAKHAGIAPSTLDRLESGDPHVGLETLARACRAVGLDLSVRVFPGRPPSLRDTGQLAIAEHLRSQAHPSWHTALELLVDEASTPRAIDLALFGA